MHTVNGVIVMTNDKFYCVKKSTKQKMQQSQIENILLHKPLE